MENRDLLHKIRSAEFRKNNGRVLCTINILRNKFVKLESAQDALQKEMDEGDFLDCINFLHKADYIELRTVVGHQKTNIADTDYIILEGAISEKGIRLLDGDITDNLVRT